VSIVQTILKCQSVFCFIAKFSQDKLKNSQLHRNRDFKDHFLRFRDIRDQVFKKGTSGDLRNQVAALKSVDTDLNAMPDNRCPRMSEFVLATAPVIVTKQNILLQQHKDSSIQFVAAISCTNCTRTDILDTQCTLGIHCTNANVQCY